MPKVNLTLSSEYHLYALTAVFNVSKPPIYDVAIFDTGSATSSITKGLAEKLGVNLYNLPSKLIAGSTGIRKFRCISKIDIMLLSSKTVTLQDVAILENTHKEVPMKRNGMKVGNDIFEASVPNILGLDFLVALKGKAIISPSENLAYIEW